MSSFFLNNELKLKLVKETSFIDTNTSLQPVTNTDKQYQTHIQRN